MGLADKRCVPCEGGVIPLFRPRAEELLKEVPDWQLSADAKSISRKFTFRNFKEALVFVNKIGSIAEGENHHPDISFGWGKAIVELSTHAIGGLSENDYILAAKIDEL